MAIFRLTDRDFTNEIAPPEDLHLMQALDRTVARLEGSTDEPDHTLCEEASAVLASLGFETSDAAAAEGRMGDRTERLYGLDDALIDRARAALMAAADPVGDDLSTKAAIDAVRDVRTAIGA